MMGSPKNLVIVDDHEFFRKGIVLTVEKFNFIKCTGEASSGEEFLEMLKNQVPCDIVLMDISMPGMGGVEATRKALEMNPSLRIAALSMFGEEQYFESMLDAGAVAFIVKNIDAVGLEYALKVIAEGKNYYSPEVVGFLAHRRSRKRNKKVTRREIDIIELIARGYTNQQIADELGVSLRTITNHRANLHKKVGVKNTVGLLAWAMKEGIITKL